MFKEINFKKLLHTMNIIYTHKFKVTSKKGRKKTQKAITRLIHEYHIQGTQHEYHRAIGNAMAHGKIPVKCKVYISDKRQLFCVIQDSGIGFDYKEVVKKFMNNEVYFHNHGFGTKCYARNNHLIVDWKNNGTTIILYYKTFSKKV